MRNALAALTLLSVLAMAPACGGGGDDDGGGGGGGDGDGDGVDGGVVAADATPYTGLGQTCEGDGQGNCPTGFECIALAGGSWCSKMCENGDHEFCQTGYAGPGIPACIVGVSTDGDMVPEFTMCGIVCEGIQGTGCTPETCDGTCPDDLACTSPVSNGEEEVGKACE